MTEQLDALLDTQILMQLGGGIAPSVTIPASKMALYSAEYLTVGPVPDDDISLLSAIDGIRLNEIDPLTETTEIE